MTQSRTAAAIRAFEAGEIVVVTDDDGRENEGDLIVAADALHARAHGVHRAPHERHRVHAHAGVGGQAG